MNILLIGLPGAGKGTHGEILRKKYNIYHLSSGKVIRNVARKELITRLKGRRVCQHDGSNKSPEKVEKEIEKIIEEL